VPLVAAGAVQACERQACHLRRSQRAGCGCRVSEKCENGFIPRFGEERNAVFRTGALPIEAAPFWFRDDGGKIVRDRQRFPEVVLSRNLHLMAGGTTPGPHHMTAQAP